ncbi:hypothetical protein BD770DRAFT_411253 [Pilaira anomala]|nr:hypothetical protein BD770DRAFT_411253 [Pilaira anomala]
MSNHFNNALPIEILKNIFQNLIVKWRGEDYPIKNSSDYKNKAEDIKTCLSVCRSWQVAAQEFFNKISIRVSEDSLEALSKDVVTFAQKVKSIRLIESRSANFDRTVTCLVWFDIILACPNLDSIKINVSDDSGYVRCLMDTTTERLSRIQKFSTSTSQLHFQLNLKYCKSITELCIPSLSWTSRNDGDNNLIYFISLFPKLTYFRIYNRVRYEDLEDAVDIIQFLEAAPQLQKLRISKVKEIKGSSITTSENSSCLTVLRLTAREMDINSLIFIKNRLKKLNQLYISIDSWIMDIPPQEVFGSQEFNAKELLDYLVCFTSDISQFHIRYVFESIIYTLENGKEPEEMKSYEYEDIYDNNDYFYYDNANEYYDYD